MQIHSSVLDRCASAHECHTCFLKRTLIKFLGNHPSGNTILSVPDFLNLRRASRAYAKTGLSGEARPVGAGAQVVFIETRSKVPRKFH